MADEARLKPGDYAALQVVDNGSGMSNKTRDRIFEPFFTTRTDEGGTGLGMASVYAIVDRHDGHIRVESELGAGTTIHILLPLTKQPFDAGAAFVSATPMRILVVDDDSLIRASTARILIGAHHIVTLAGSVKEAIDAVRDAPEFFDMVLTDVAMPKQRGTVLVRELAREAPKVRVSFMSAYTDDADAEVLGYPMLKKPFTSERLLSHVDELSQRAWPPTECGLGPGSS